MKIYVVIITYNGMKWIDDCLKSLVDNTIEFSILIVDNNSTDNTINFIKNNYPDVKLFIEKENLGFGVANNIGISYALKNKADYVFLLNQDAFVELNTIESLIQVSEKNTDYGIISPIHYNGKGTLLDDSFSYYIRNFNCDNFISDCVLQKPKKDIYSLPMINAAAWLLPKKTLDTVGGFDPIFFLYGEDDNYCQRVLFHKLKIGITSNTFIRHDSNNNFKPEFKKGSDKYYDKFIIRLKVVYADVNNNKYKDFKKLKMFFLKESLKYILKFKIRDFKISLKKRKIVECLDLKKSVLKNRSKGKSHLNLN